MPSSIQFSTEESQAPDPLIGANNDPDCAFSGPATANAKSLPPGFMDPNGAFLSEPSRPNRDDLILKLPKPEYQWAEKEKNAFHREFFKESEAQSLLIHDKLTFWKDEVIPEEPVYPDFEAEMILESTDALNDEQRAAVLSSTDDLILHALAGTGKTRSVSSMIAYLIAIGKTPSKIAVSSHTVTAAQEIKSRVEPMIETLFPRINQFRAESPQRWIQAGTIHAIAYREIGKFRHPRARHAIIEESNQIKIWKESCQFALGPDYSNEEDTLILEWMRLHERIRGMAIPEARIPEILHSITKSERLPKIAETYRKIKEARELLDYTDLLRLWIPLLIHPGYKTRWEYFFVDEYQDTSPLQKFILKILRFQETKVIVCGDIRQSITSFTGSDPSVQSPMETLPGPTPAKEMWLQVNYRCSQEIIELANQILGNMLPSEKHQLTCWDGAEEGSIIKLCDIVDKNQEYRTTIAEAINLKEELDAELGEKKSSVAILYRTNSQGSKLEETIAEMNSRLVKMGKDPITYTRKDYRRTALRARTEREISAMLHAWATPAKGRWFEILTSPYFPGIGEVTANTISAKAAKKKSQSIEEMWEVFDGEIPSRSLENVGNFLTAWEGAAAELGDSTGLELLPSDKAVSFLKAWMRKSLESSNGQTKGEGESLSKKEIEDGQRRSYEASFLEKIEREGNAPLKETLKKVEDEARKEEEEDAGGQERATGIILSTIHLAKGKEFDGAVVHNVSWYSLPHYNAIQQEEIADGILERRWRKLCSLEAESLADDPELIEHILKTPEVSLPKVVPYPKDAFWGKTQNEAEREEDDGPAVPPNHSVAWDWMTNPIEEEKRLLYVAVTRARKRLVITSSSKKSHPFFPARIWWKLQERERLTGANPEMR